MKLPINDKPLISIIVPVYNVEQYLNRSVDSLLKQTYTNLEILLVDDESTDRSSIICDNYASCDNRIKVIHKKNGGLSDARNIALDQMTGAYVTFVDSDDYVASDMIEKFWCAIIENEAEMVTSGKYLIDANGAVFDTKGIQNKRIISGEEAAKDIMRDLYPQNFATGKIYLSSLFNDIRFPKGRLYEDTAVTYRIAAKCQRVCYLPDNLYYYEIGRPGNITSELQTAKAVKSYLDGITNCHERLNFIAQNINYQDIRPTIIKQLHLWALLAIQSAISSGYTSYLKIHHHVMKAISCYNDRPRKLSLRLALSYPTIYYIFYPIIKIIRK